MGGRHSPYGRHRFGRRLGATFSHPRCAIDRPHPAPLGWPRHSTRQLSDKCSQWTPSLPHHHRRRPDRPRGPVPRCPLWSKRQIRLWRRHLRSSQPARGRAIHRALLANHTCGRRTLSRNAISRPWPDVNHGREATRVVGEGAAPALSDAEGASRGSVSTTVGAGNRVCLRWDVSAAITGAHGTLPYDRADVTHRAIAEIRPRTGGPDDEATRGDRLTTSIEYGGRADMASNIRSAPQCQATRLTTPSIARVSSPRAATGSGPGSPARATSWPGSSAWRAWSHPRGRPPGGPLGASWRGAERSV